MRNSSGFGLIFFLVLLGGVVFVGSAFGQKKATYFPETAFKPLVIIGKVYEEKITAPAPKQERCTICTFKTPLLIEGRIAKKQKRNSGRMAYAKAIKTLKEVVGMITPKSDTIVAQK